MRTTKMIQPEFDDESDMTEEKSKEAVGRMKSKYFEWLYKRVFGFEIETQYYLLCNHLFNIEFHWFVPNDDNREMDGRRLREDFSMDIFQAYFTFWKAPANVFEVLVGICYRLSFQLEDPTKLPQLWKWMTMLISNLGLAEFTDDNWNSSKARKVDERITRFMTRKYDELGRDGGLFPLTNPNAKNQRKVEIWYQMMAYIGENYRH